MRVLAARDHGYRGAVAALLLTDAEAAGLRLTVTPAGGAHGG
jgi:hypothetical protein